jgi:hypothetical protein
LKKKSSRGGAPTATEAVSPPKAGHRAVRGSSRAERVHSSMSRAVTEKIEGRASEFNPQTQKVYERAMTGRSRKDAMTAFCVMCMGYNPNEVKNCTDPACPLYPYR